MAMNRNMYHPVSIGADFVRKNVFELIISSGNMALNSTAVLCKSLNVKLPTSNSVQIPWIGGVMQVAGRFTDAFSFEAGFLVGHDYNYDAFRTLYEWRNNVENHETGQLSLAHAYKATGNVRIYAVDGTLKYNIQIDGMWPTNIPNIDLSVEADGVLDLSVTFAADRIWVPELY